MMIYDYELRWLFMMTWLLMYYNDELKLMIWIMLSIIDDDLNNDELWWWCIMNRAIVKMMI
jgi:hypothetical protein